MSWEIQGQVETASDVDALVQHPSEAPEPHEVDQVKAVAVAVKQLLAAKVVAGDLFVRAGGHANPGGGPAEGEVNEMVTLSIGYFVAPEPEPAAVATEAVDAPAVHPDIAAQRAEQAAQASAASQAVVDAPAIHPDLEPAPASPAVPAAADPSPGA